MNAAVLVTLWLFLLIVNIVSRFGLRAFGVVLQVVLTAIALYAVIRWRLVSLTVAREGIVVRDLKQRAEVHWDEITHFRDPFSDTYPTLRDRIRRRDVGVVDLVGGRTLRIRALQGAGGYPLWVAPFAVGPRLTQRLSWLNALRQQFQLQDLVRQARGSSNAPSAEDGPAVWETVYELRSDRLEIQTVQDATLHSPGMGLKPEPALFGSPEWWGAIDTGRLPTFVVEGVIEDVFMTGHNDFPEFRMRLEDGTTFEFVRYGDESRYVPGARVRMTCVEQHFKDDTIMLAGESSSTIVALLVEIARSERANPVGNA